MIDQIMDDIIVSKFDEEHAMEFRKNIMRRAMLDSNAPIVVYIDSYGGEADSCISMIETLNQVPNPIITVCLAKAMSCGAILLSVGDRRFCGRDSRVMIHHGSIGWGESPIEELRNSTIELERFDDKIMTLLAKKCNKTLAELKKLIKDNGGRNLYLDAEASLKFGIVDEIGMPSVKPIVVYSVEVVPEKKYSITKPTEKKVKKNKTIKKRT